MFGLIERGNIGYNRCLMNIISVVLLIISASFMVPTRIMPNYKLWKLFVEKENYGTADKYAEKIMSQHLKVENTVTLTIKGEVLKYLEGRKL